MTVNGQPHPDTPANVAALVQALALGQRRVAVAVNGAVVPRSTWDAHPLNDDDCVEIVHAVGGG
jgi:sulfur carrier protein